MAYTPQTWVDGSAGGTPVSAARLNYIEAGIVAAGTGAGVLAPTAVKTTAYTVAVGELAMMNVAGGATTLTLPSAPADKAQVGYRAIGATTAVPLVINRGGTTDTIGTAGATSASIPLADEVAVLQYDAANTRWLGVSNVKTQASLDARYSSSDPSNPATYGTVDLTGATGSAAAIQAAIDAGQKKLTLRGGTYLIDAPIFADVDTSSISGPYIIEGLGGTTIKLKGSGLPTVSTHTADAAVWGFHVNQKRSFLSGGVVTYVADAAHRASGGGFPSHPEIIFRNCFIDSDTALAGLVYGNTAVARFENCTFKTLKYGMSWTGYADGASASHCETFGMASGGWLVFQTTNGDGVSIDNIKAASGNGIWSAQACHGGSVRNTIQGGFSFTNCSGISVDNSHSELGGSGNALAQFITTNCSQLVIDHAFNYASSTAGQYFLYINDAASDATFASDVTLRNFRTNYFFGTDAARQPDIYINATNAPFKLRVENVTADTIRSGRTEESADGIVVASAVSGITTAVANARGLVASAHWTLRQTNGTWEIVQPSPAAGMVTSRALQPPTFASIVNTTTSFNGTLVNGTNYEYAMACRDYAGNYSQVSAASTIIAAGTAGALTWQAGIPTSPCMLVIWRKTAGTAGQVLTVPDAYVEIPIDAPLTKIHDTGTRASGRPWITTSVPVPNTVAATNHTGDGLLFSDGTFIAKTALASAGAATTSQRIASSSTLVTVVNTVTETDLARLTIPGGQPSANDRYILTAYGDLLNSAGSTVTYVFKAYLGSTLLLTTVASGMTVQGSRRTWELRFELDIVSTTSQLYKGRLDGLGTPSGTTWNPVSTSGLFLGVGTQAQDTSTSKDIALTVTMGTAVATADARCLSAHLQRIPA